jgi:hypothetical protein
MGDSVTLDTALSLWDIVIAVGGTIGFVWTKLAGGKQERERQDLERELAAQRGRLDQLDRVHSRRVQQIETLYGAVEHACWLCFGANPPAEIRGRPELDTARQAFREARIYLDDATADVCMKLMGKCALVLSNAERLNATSQGNAMAREWEVIQKAVEAGDKLRDELCSRLQTAIGALPASETPVKRSGDSGSTAVAVTKV